MENRIHGTSGSHHVSSHPGNPRGLPQRPSHRRATPWLPPSTPKGRTGKNGAATASTSAAAGDRHSTPTPTSPKPAYNSDNIEAALELFYNIDGISEAGNHCAPQEHAYSDCEDLWGVFIDLQNGLEALKKLSPKQHEALMRHYAEGYTQEEVADLLQITQQSVDERCKSGLVHLTQLINDAVPQPMAISAHQKRPRP